MRERKSSLQSTELIKFTCSGSQTLFKLCLQGASSTVATGRVNFATLFGTNHGSTYLVLKPFENIIVGVICSSSQYSIYIREIPSLLYLHKKLHPRSILYVNKILQKQKTGVGNSLKPSLTVYNVSVCNLQCSVLTTNLIHC